MCKNESIKEVHVTETITNTYKLCLCKDHFKQEMKFWKKFKFMIVIFDLTPKVDDRIKVDFT